jgi:hypothetical protein
MFRDLGPGRGATLEELVLAADRSQRLPPRGVAIQVVDPYAEPRKEEEDEAPT